VAIERAGSVCERCRLPGRLEVHHRRYLARGGALYDMANLEVLCRRCHFREHAARTPGRREWVERVNNA